MSGVVHGVVCCPGPAHQRAPVEGFGRQSHGATKFAQHSPYGDISAKKLAQHGPSSNSSAKKFAQQA